MRATVSIRMLRGPVAVALLLMGLTVLFARSPQAASAAGANFSATTVQGAASGLLPVWRFRNTRMHGSYLWTADLAEKTNLVDHLGSTWLLEGQAFSVTTSDTANNTPLWRFRNKADGTYFYTADPAEKTNLVDHLGAVWRLEGPTWNVSLAPASKPVWRFLCLKNGTHFWTSDAAEKSTIETTMGSIYKLEGIAYYLGTIPADQAAGTIPADQAVGWVVGSYSADGYGVILHTTDGGGTWTRQGSASDVPSTTLDNVKAVDSRTAWVVGDAVGGYGVILRTSDAGQTWVRQGAPGTIPDAAIEGISVVDSTTVWVVGSGGIILKSDDAGQSWVQQTSGTETPLFEIEAVNSQEAWAVGDSDGEYAIVLHTSNGGATWERQGTKATLGATAFIDLTVVDSQTAWAVGADQYISHTTDGGASWHLQLGPGLDHVNGVCAVNRQVAWAAVDYNHAYRTVNGGAHWDYLHMQDMPVGYLLGVSALDASTAWVVGGAMYKPDWGVILRTTDAGATWQVQSTPVNVTFRRASFLGSYK